MENNEFHKSFIKSLIFIAVVTMFAMVLTDKFINNYLSHKYKTPTFTSYNSYNEAKAEE